MLRACSLAILVVILAACDRSPCDQTCRHVAACKRDKANGGEVGATSAPDADPTCMERCQAEKPEFAACEGKKRECGAVLSCINY
jgi:hypothetical protein